MLFYQLAWRFTTLALVGLLAPWAIAQNQPSEPVYRVATETPAAAPVSLARPQAAFDLVQKPGEHPLMPTIRLLKTCLAEFDQNVQDYTCTLVKQERIDGELGENQHILLKVRRRPFSVYMSFLKPYVGREVIYVVGQNEGKMLVLESGWKRKVLGKMQLDPEGMIAMRGQKHPITKVGIHNLLKTLVERAEGDTQYGECDVTTNADVKIDGRSTTMVQLVHPVPRKNFDSHIKRLFIDNELRLPIHYDSFLWPEEPGQDPPLLESYTYRDLKINNSFTARDFDPDNPNIFKP